MIEEPDSKKAALTRIVRLVSGGIGVVGLCVGGYGMFHYAPLGRYPWKIFLYGGGVGVVFLLLLLGTALSIKRFVVETFPIKQVFGILPVLAAMILGIGIISYVNGAFDTQGPQEFETVIVKRRVPGSSGTKARPPYYEVIDFRPGRGNSLLRLQLLGLSEGQANEGDRIIVVAGPGVFQWWYNDVRIAEKAHKTPTVPTAAPTPAHTTP